MRRARWVVLLAALAGTAAQAAPTPRLAAGQWIEHAGSRWRLVATTATGSMPWGVSVSRDGASLHVTHVGEKDHDNVYRYDTGTLAIAARSRFRGHAVESVPSPDGRTLVVSNSRRHELVVLDAASLALVARHGTGKIPKDLRLSPAGDVAYVADYGAGTLSAIDLVRGTRRSVPVGQRPRGVAVSPDGSRVYVANQGSGTLSVVDAATLAVVSTVRACSAPRHIAVTPDGRLLLVSCFGARQLAVLDAATGERVRRVGVGTGPKTVVITGDGRVALVADEGSNSLTLVDLGSWAALTVPLPAEKPCGLAIAPDDRHVYVTARGSNQLLVLERAR
jgi:YVTN family beta-propeller protein